LNNSREIFDVFQQ